MRHFLSIVLPVALFLFMGTVFVGTQYVINKHDAAVKKSMQERLDQEQKVRLEKETQLQNLQQQVQQLQQQLSELSNQLQAKEVTNREPTVQPLAKEATEVESKVKETYTIKATAYGTSARNGGNGTGKTRTGTRPVEGRTIAVDPHLIPLGTKVKIECDSFPEINGTYVAEDTGGAINGKRIDIYMDDSKRSRMLDFGVRTVKVSVLY